ncbi:MAG TPA: GTPase HflX [Candidatus Acidoferrales bacterium]
MRKPQQVQSVERAYLVAVALKRPARVPGYSRNHSEWMDELAELTRSAGGVVVGKSIQSKEAFDPAYLIGRGKLQEIRAEAGALEADLIIFGQNLSPTQQRNLEKEVACRVIDRTQLILDIFARHARSREGQLQIELAQLNYLLPRLTGRGVELSRLGAGIGTRGPGEQKLEKDRRRIRERIRRIKAEIEAVRRQRATRRAARQAVPLGTVALVGYTNAGKSTLFNKLTRAEVYISDQMFATLDPTLRLLELPSRRRFLLSDTVGFIRDLPPGLVAAFRATLEELQEAALLVHVSDLADPHHPEHEAEVQKVLGELGLAGKPCLSVYNKIDLLGPEERGDYETGNGKVYVSALKEIGLERLLQCLDEALVEESPVRITLRLPASDGRTLALLHRYGRVVRKEYHSSGVVVEAEVSPRLAENLRVYSLK